MGMQIIIPEEYERELVNLELKAKWGFPVTR